MRTLVIVACLFFLQQSSTRYLPLSSGKHSPVTMSTKIHLPTSLSGKAFTALLEIGTGQHIPLGIVLAPGTNDGLCRSALSFASVEMTMANLISEFNSEVPGYHAELRNGVLNIEPVPISQPIYELLNLKIARFQSQPETHAVMGSNLWFFIRAILAPHEATIGGGLSPTTVERVPSIQVANENVRTILNDIVDEGNGGLWLLRASRVNQISRDLQRPYDVYGYFGEEQQLTSSLDNPEMR